jgi:hypothetical protein
LLAIIIAIATAGSGGSSRSRPALPPVRANRPARVRHPAAPTLRARLVGQLPAPVQDAAVTALPVAVSSARPGATPVTRATPIPKPAARSGASGPQSAVPVPPRARRRPPRTDPVVMGGLNTADSSVADILVLQTGRTLLVRAHQVLPAPLHDAAATTLGSSAYLFGGGQLERGSTEILRVSSTGVARLAGRLPAPAADVGAAALNGVAYVVGGYTGSQALDTIVAWRPGQPARVVAHLPAPLRYPAVAAAGGHIIIVGGTTPTAAATPDVLSFDPATGQVQPIGKLRHPVTHAAAGILGTSVYVLGGRGAGRTSQHRFVLALDPRTGRSTSAGVLPHRVSDAGAVTLPDRILLIGGRDNNGTVRSDVVSVQRRRPRAGPFRQRSGWPD